MSEQVCPVCGADRRFDERCSPTAHKAHTTRMEERAKVVAFLRRAPLNGPAETVYADAIERGEHDS